MNGTPVNIEGLKRPAVVNDDGMYIFGSDGKKVREWLNCGGPVFTVPVRGSHHTSDQCVDVGENVHVVHVHVVAQIGLKDYRIDF